MSGNIWAGVAKAAPYVFQAVSDVSQSRSQAKYLRRQARTAERQGFADEEAQRREAREVAGAQAAAMAQSGTGMEGSNEMLVRQSAALAELDALNIRYKSLLTAYSLRKEAKAVKKAGLFSGIGNILKSGSAFMDGAGGGMMGGMGGGGGG